LPSSRLTKILQEKAELLKKRRASAEQVLHEAEERVRLLDGIGIRLPETVEREAQIETQIRRADWDTAESKAKELLEYLSTRAVAEFDARRKEIGERGDRIAQFGLPVPEAFRAALAAASAASPAEDWARSAAALGDLDRQIRSVENDYSATLRGRARALAEWAGEPAEQQTALDGRLRQALEPIREGRIKEALHAVNETIPISIPLAVERRDRARAAGRGVLLAAQDLGVESQALEATLRSDAETLPIDWQASVTLVEESAAQVGNTLRERVTQTLESLRATLESLREYDVDPAPYLVSVGEALGMVGTVEPTQVASLLNQARATVEEPVVSIVASLLDAVRPRLVEARRLGRDPSDVFAAMNRAREALRLKIYSEALAASQEAIERVSGLTADLDTARSETDSLDEMLQRLQSAHFPTAPFAGALHRIRDHLDRVDLEPARELLRSTFQTLGNEAAAFFTREFETLEKVLPAARERGFLPPGAEEELAKVRQYLDDGELADAGELLAGIEVRVRTAAGPYVARRVEELERGFSDIPDESLVAPVRRMLADADVTLRVKEDLPGSLDALKRAEREFTSVFAAHASSLVEALEEERRVLESMGGAGDEIQRQIDEVEQIFNMGDFVKASRASQEIRTRAHQQQLVRSEEAISHAKLGLVELSKMGVDVPALRSSLDEATEAARAVRYADAYKLADETEKQAVKLKGKAQSILTGLTEANALWQTLRQAGVPVEAHRERIRLVQAAYQALDFEGAKDGLDVLMALLKSEQASAETRRLLSEASLLREDGQRLAVPIEPFSGRIDGARTALEEGRTAEALSQARTVHIELVQLLKPVLAENIRNLEQDLEVGRSAGIEIQPIVEILGEARRRLALSVPTGVTELVESARTRLVESRGFFEHAERGLKRATEAVNQAELVHVAAPSARESLGAVEAAIGRRDYAKGIELASTLEREMLQLTYEHVSRTLAGFQGLLIHSRPEGTDTALAENLLMQARTALEEGRPVEALQLAGRSESELERVELQLRLAQGALKIMESKLGEAGHEGVRARIAEAKFFEAQGAYGDRLFPVVLELALDASDSLSLSREAHRRAREALDSSDRQIKEAVEVGADLGEVVGVLDAARTAFQDGEYPDATRKAREAAERARWAIERLYAGVLSEVRLLLDTARSAGLAELAEKYSNETEEAEGALKVREWRKASEGFQRARDSLTQSLTAALETRGREVEAAYHDEGTVEGPELEFRAQAKRRATDEAARGSYAAALGILREEETRARDRWRLDLEGRVTTLKDRLWVGEKLGLDTTPVMERFSEAQLGLSNGRLDEVREKVQDGEVRLKSLVADRLPDRMRDTQTELVFAQDGLHVALADVMQRMRTVPELLASGLSIEAAQVVLESSEELNRRKALHRELMNLHYLIDAALGKASELRLDTSEPRKLLDESIQARSTDYALALVKAREALRLLQERLKIAEPPVPTPAQTAPTFWPFRRPPGQA
jgi:hypothetical protein